MMILQVAIGGALGAVLRYLCALAISFPFATLFVNVLGSLVMGLVFVWLTEYGAARGLTRWQPLIMTGFLGGFTTFSAFSLDALRLFESGNAAGALGYIGGTFALCLTAVAVGVAFGRWMLL